MGSSKPAHLTHTPIPPPTPSHGNSETRNWRSRKKNVEKENWKNNVRPQMSTLETDFVVFYFRIPFPKRSALFFGCCHGSNFKHIGIIRNKRQTDVVTA